MGTSRVPQATGNPANEEEGKAEDTKEGREMIDGQRWKEGLVSINFLLRWASLVTDRCHD